MGSVARWGEPDLAQRVVRELSTRPEESPLTAIWPWIKHPGALADAPTGQRRGNDGDQYRAP